MTSNGPIWPAVGIGRQLVKNIKFGRFFHIEAEVRVFGLRFQVMASMAIWGKIVHIWPKLAYNVQIYLLVARYDNFWTYQFLHYQFWPTSALLGRFDYIAIKMPSKGKLARNGPQWYYMSCYIEVFPYIHIWRSAAHSFQFWIIGTELATYVFLRQRHCIIQSLMVPMASFSKRWPRILHSMKYERFSPYRGRSEKPRC